MILSHDDFDPAAFVRERFAEVKITLGDVDVRRYPEETIVVVRVDKTDAVRAIDFANDLDRELAQLGFDGFITVKELIGESSAGVKATRVANLSDTRISDLVNLLAARSRTSEVQPSLRYVSDVQGTVDIVATPRHHLVFGRRGAGKTAVLVEARSKIMSEGHLSVWLNVHTYRHESADRLFLHTCQRLCETVQARLQSEDQVPRMSLDAQSLYDNLGKQLAASEPDGIQVARDIPKMQTLLSRFLSNVGCRLYIFLDDFHYLNRDHQPRVLDMIHGAVRDCDAWLKVAAIEHLARWYDPTGRIGLQTGHDAADIDLDVTLQDPSKAKKFLETVLLGYAQHAHISSISNVLSGPALDRLVLASGAVPRDYLTLCGRSLQVARQREKAKQVGVQDVNKAAGDAKQKKLDELEEDAASAKGESSAILAGLQEVRRFCIDEKNATYFRVDFRDKDDHNQEYGLLEQLMDLRLIHMIDPSLSDEHKAGQRAEVFMLDLSQYAGQRLKRKLRVLDYKGGHLVLKRTGTKQPAVIGDTANKRLGVLRRGPEFPLDRLSSGAVS